MSLQDEIIERSSKIFRDAYQMSIGELINIGLTSNLVTLL